MLLLKYLLQMNGLHISSRLCSFEIFGAYSLWNWFKTGVEFFIEEYLMVSFIDPFFL